MSYTLESVNGCTKKLVFNFETLNLSAEIKTAIAKKQKSVNIKGFRKGKAPVAMVEKIYGPQIENEALNNFIQAQLYEAIQKEELRVVGYPSLANMNYEPGKSVAFDATVEIFPTVELKDYSKLEFEKETVTFEEKELEELRKNYLNNKAEMVALEDEGVTLANGHFAVLNFQGVKEDGEKPENMKGEEFLLEIGSNQFIPGFEEGMVGMKASEKKSIDLSFPADYHVDELKRAKVTFEVELLEIKEKRFPEFSDEIAKELGYESMEDFNTKNKELIVKQKERKVNETLHQQILEKLIDENKFDVPDALIAQQKQHIQEDVKNNLRQQGFTEEMMTEYFNKWSADVDTKALFQVKSGLILDKLSKEFEVEATNEDFDEKLREMSAGSGMEFDQVKKYYSSNENLKNNIMYAIREEKTFEKIKERVKLK